MIPDRKILQAAVAVQTDATGSDPSHWHSNLDGTVAGETLLGPTCEKFLRGIRKRLGNWGAGRVCGWGIRDRKSTRLNSSHGYISYAVFCLKKKKQDHTMTTGEPVRAGDRALHTRLR